MVTMDGSESVSMAKNPLRVAAGRKNGCKRRPWGPEDRQRLRELALRNKPWKPSTGPRSEEGKYRSAANGWHHKPRACLMNPKS